MQTGVTAGLKGPGDSHALVHIAMQENWQTSCGVLAVTSRALSCGTPLEHELRERGREGGKKRRDGGSVGRYKEGR
ncbi:hypothetical protein E2C01_044659 [Portunus trituberculatus]|uniref:Uncharacterized protein n=1 Tax=Portunus trituberculatus TaxID=210409 RepID=A0A5B7FZT6_PORTR|nr:hypothetical protein [Portunus trituberculatus]